MILIHKNTHPSSPPPHSPSLSHSPSRYPPTSPHNNIASKNPLLKLDVKFDLPMYNGDPNAKKIDNWIRQNEFIVMFTKLMKKR